MEPGLSSFVNKSDRPANSATQNSKKAKQGASVIFYPETIFVPFHGVEKKNRDPSFRETASPLIQTQGILIQGVFLGAGKLCPKR